MYVVAITELATPPDEEAAHLAQDIGVTAYEMRIALTAGFPAVVLTTTDRAFAKRVFDRVIARKHLAVACDERQVIDAEHMISLKRFRFDADGARTDESPRDLLAYGDILAIIRATHRSRRDVRTTTIERTFSPARAVLTGGLVMTGTRKREESHAKDERENVVYVFRRSGERPWILRQEEAKYQGLGTAMQPTAALNFARVVEILRDLAPAAVFDTRLVSVKRIPERNIDMSGSASGSVFASFTYGVDLLAHMLAVYFAQKDAASPYRR